MWTILVRVKSIFALPMLSYDFVSYGMELWGGVVGLGSSEFGSLGLHWDRAL